MAEYGNELPTGSFGTDISDAPAEDIDRWNRAWRASPLYDRIVRRMGLNPQQAGGIHLSEAQRLELQGELNQAMGGNFAGHDVHLDRAGNMHGNSSLIKRIAIGAAIGGAALTGFGLAGVGPLGGLGGAGAAASGGTAALGGETAGLPSTIIGTGAIPGISAAGGGLGGATAGGLGGALGAIGKFAMNPYIRSVGDIAKSVLAGRHASREEQNAANARADVYRLHAAEFNRNAPLARAHQAVRGDILAGVQPVQFTGSGRDLGYTGGLTPALLSQGSRDLGSSMNRNAVLSQLQGGGAPGSDAFTLGPATPLERAGALDKILAGVNMAADILPTLPQRRQVPGLNPYTGTYDDPNLVGGDY